MKEERSFLLKLFCIALAFGSVQIASSNNTWSNPSVFTHDYSSGPFIGLPQYTFNGSHVIKAKITNLGTSNESNVPIKFVCDSSLVSTFQLSLNAGAYDTVSFEWIANVGTHTLKIISALSTDENRFNDTVSASVQVFLNPYVTSSFCRRAINKTINDLSTVYDTIFVNMPGMGVADVNLTIDTVLHTWDGDLSFSLRRLSTIGNLIDHVGGSGNNFIGTRLNDSAFINISNGTPPFTGTFSPHDPLSWFNASYLVTPNGAWILEVNDNAFGDTGLLESWCITISAYTGVGIEPVETTIPENYKLSQNYPNPFNPVTNIKFSLPSPSEGGVMDVKLIVYDILGREITNLIPPLRGGQEGLSPGTYEVEWDGTNYPSGIYFYKLIAGDYVETRKMVLIK